MWDSEWEIGRLTQHRTGTRHRNRVSFSTANADRWRIRGDALAWMLHNKAPRWQGGARQGAVLAGGAWQGAALAGRSTTRCRAGSEEHKVARWQGGARQGDVLAGMLHHKVPRWQVCCITRCRAGRDAAPQVVPYKWQRFTFKLNIYLLLHSIYNVLVLLRNINNVFHKNSLGSLTTVSCLPANVSST